MKHNQGKEIEIKEGRGEEKSDRRDFIGRSARGLAGVAVIVAAGREASIILGGGSKALAASAEEEYQASNHLYVYLVDIEKCIGCGSCVRACERENDVPRHYFRTWVERYHVYRTGHVEVDSPNGARDGFIPPPTDKDVTKGFFVPKLCNHCTLTPCVQLCPVGASYRTRDGIVLVDEKRCIGCGYCVQACPYGSRFIHPTRHIASKCTLCYHRITKGLMTACVEACPVGARMLGDRKKVNDEVSEIIATRHVHVLKPELLTQPNCYYLGLSMEVR